MEKRYIKKLDMELSPLGFGVMRLPMEGDKISGEAYRLMEQGMKAGINYYDTAYPYQRGFSEIFLHDTVVDQYPRHTFHIADKLPVWLCTNMDDMERIFQTQMDRLGVNYIDLYLLHGLHQSRWQDIYQKGVLDFLDRKKKEGKILKAGFSMHDTTETLVSILNTYDWDFTQLQINYYDWSVQHAKESYESLEKRDIPCIVMEPVGGGRLGKLPGTAEKLLKDLKPDDSIASWAVRYVASLPNVAVTLSGMGNQEQLLDNISSFDPIIPMTVSELETLDKVVQIIHSYQTIPCTSCRYCVEECPKTIDIPHIFQQYNDYKMFDNASSLDIEYFTFIPDEKKASACISCGKCSKRCPQGIKIYQELKMVHDTAMGLSLGFDISKIKRYINWEKGSLLVCFGAGRQGRTAKTLLEQHGYRVDYFCDNAEHLWGTSVDGIPVISSEQLKVLEKELKVLVIITSTYEKEIRIQLNELNIPVI